MFADSYGEGTAQVLAMHGWGRTRADWAPALKNHRALAVDLPGFGLTPAPESPQGSDWYAEQLVPLVQQLGRPILAGHSFGGRVAVHIAQQVPEHVGGLILTGAPLLRRTPSRKPSLGYRIVRALHKVGVVGETSMDKARNKYGSADYRATSGVMRSTFVKVVNEGYDGPLAAVASAAYPVALIWGADDDQVPLAVAEELHRRIPRSEFTSVVGSGHLMDTAVLTAVDAALGRMGAAL